jgi:hypothetical protein
MPSNIFRFFKPQARKILAFSRRFLEIRRYEKDHAVFLYSFGPSEHGFGPGGLGWDHLDRDRLDCHFW